MERYWNERAQEDPFHYVDNREELGAPDQAAFWAGGEQVVDQLLHDLGVGLGGSEDVIEIGCGIGRLTRALAHRASSVQALDVSEEMLVHARNYNPELHNVNWIHGDGTTLAPLPDAGADACISFVVFQHLPDPELTYGYVREMGRVLRPGGWAGFQVSNDPSIHVRPTGIARLRETTRAILRRGPRTQHEAWRGSAVELSELKRAAQESGLEIERIKDPGTLFCFVLARRLA
jgi:SAM-dependent methyltransferase